MHRIHFIWWGDPAAHQDIHRRKKHMDAAFTGPNKLAMPTGSNLEVHYWFQAKHSATFNRYLRPGIIRRPIRSFDPLTACESDKPAVRAFRSEQAEKAKALPKVLESLHFYGAYSAMKDLTQLFVLYLEGGFYFDTTIFVPELRRFFDALEQETLFPLFVLNNPSAGPNHLFQQMEYIHVPYRINPPAQRVPAVEYWAMAARPKDAVLFSGMEQYIARWRHIARGKNEEGAWRILPEEQGNYCKGDKLKGHVVGRLVDWSVKDGLIRVFGEDYGGMEQHCRQHWPKDQIEEVENLMNNEEHYLAEQVRALLLLEKLRIDLGELEEAIGQGPNAYKALLAACFNKAQLEKLIGAQALALYGRRFLHAVLSAFKQANEKLARLPLEPIEKFDEDALRDFGLDSFSGVEKFHILSLLRNLIREEKNIPQLVSILRDAREEEIGIIYKKRKERDGKLFADLGITSLDGFKQTIREVPLQLIPPGRRVSTWFPRYHFFKQSGQTWKAQAGVLV